MMDENTEKHTGRANVQSMNFDFAIMVVNLYKELTVDKKEFVMSRQLLRSGTAVGALVREAQNAESKADFIHKLAIAQKECDETVYWLEILFRTQFLTESSFQLHEKAASSILNVIKRTIVSTRNNASNGIKKAFLFLVPGLNLLSLISNF